MRVWKNAEHACQAVSKPCIVYLFSMHAYNKYTALDQQL